jgi:hypothetical protein
LFDINYKIYREVKEMEPNVEFRFVERKIEEIFWEVGLFSSLRTGDISPEQVLEIEDITERLAKLLTDYVNQNIESEE